LLSLTAQFRLSICVQIDLSVAAAAADDDDDDDDDDFYYYHYTRMCINTI